jgi:ABC-type polysaccharide transport system permease subunit
MTFNFIQMCFIILGWYLSLGVVLAIMLDTMINRLQKKPMSPWMFMGSVIMWWIILCGIIIKEKGDGSGMD